MKIEAPDNLGQFGIVRVAELTNLDRLGIPVFGAITPMDRIATVHYGKGLDRHSAHAGAIYEAIENYFTQHFDCPQARTTSWRHLATAAEVIHPEQLPLYNQQIQFSVDMIAEWMPAEELSSGNPVWLPASSTFIRNLSYYPPSSNGVAVGPSLAKATLNAVCELIERHVVSQLFRNKTLDLGSCWRVDLSSVATTSAQLAAVLARLNNQHIHLVLIYLPNKYELPTFWAGLIDRQPIDQRLIVKMGYSTHPDLETAATKAITEAAQSRIVELYGMDELKPASTAASVQRALKISQVLDSLPLRITWAELLQRSNSEVDAADRCLQNIIAKLPAPLFRARSNSLDFLNFADVKVPVLGVKVFSADLSYNPHLF